MKTRPTTSIPVTTLRPSMAASAKSGSIAGASLPHALEMQIEVGEFFGAKEMVPVSSAHMMAEIESMGEACLAWLLDTMSQRIFVLARSPALSELMHTAQTDLVVRTFGNYATASMMVLGSLSCLSVILTRWGPKHEAVMRARPALS